MDDGIVGVSHTVYNVSLRVLGNNAMRKILGMEVGMKVWGISASGITTILIILFYYFSHTSFEQNNLGPQPLPANISNAWENAGAQSAWMRIAGGISPAFRFRYWTPGVISQLPPPDQSFDLDLEDSNITDSDLKELTKELVGFTQLRGLYLDDTKVTDAGISQLDSLTQLRLLSLSNTSVTDVGLMELTDLIQLQELDLSGTQVTDAGVAELQKKLLNLTQVMR
jgi:Leucine-rich repeat (LRR) protein